MAVAEPAGPDMNMALPQPAPALPGMHAPINQPKYPVVSSSSGAPIATAILFEDEEIRVWENRIPGGFCLPKHTHDHDYWIVTARSDGAKMSLQSKHSDWKMSWGAPGDKSIVFIKAGATEIADNPDPKSMVLVYLCEIKTGGTPVGHGTPWGSSAGVLYENTEVRVWDMRVPAGQSGTLPAELGNSLFHCDVHGTRSGSRSIGEMRGMKEKQKLGQLEDGFAFPNKKYGSTYVKVAGAAQDGTTPAGEARNDGTEPYRGIVFEVKPGAGDLATARL